MYERNGSPNDMFTFSVYDMIGMMTCVRLSSLSGMDTMSVFQSIILNGVSLRASSIRQTSNAIRLVLLS